MALQQSGGQNNAQVVASAPSYSFAGLLDALQVVVNAVALGAGQSLFSGLSRRLDFVLPNTRVFGNGSVVLWYAPRR